MRPRRTALLAVVLAVILTLATSCGGDDEAKSGQTPSASASLTGPGVDPAANFTTADRFIEALAANTAEGMANAKALVAPKSAAARYLATAQGDLVAGSGTATVTEASAGSYRLCAGTTCTEIAGLVLTDGKISSFKVDGKQVR